MHRLQQIEAKMIHCHCLWRCLRVFCNAGAYLVWI